MKTPLKTLRCTMYFTSEDLPLVAAMKLGYFAEEGYQIEGVQCRPSSERVKLLNQGAIQFATGLGNRVSTAVRYGDDLKVVLVTMIAGQDPLLSHNPGIRSLHDLFAHIETTDRKAVVGVNGPMCTDHTKLEHRFVAAGYSTEKIGASIDFQPAAGSDTVCSSLHRLQMIAAGNAGLDAFFLHAPYHVVAEEMGFTTLLADDTQAAPFNNTLLKGIVVNGTFLRKEPGAVDMLVRTVMRGLKWVQETPAKTVQERMIEWFDYANTASEVREMQAVTFGDRIDEAPNITAEMIAKRSYDAFMAGINPTGKASDAQLRLLAELHDLPGEPIPSTLEIADFSAIERVAA